MFGLIGKMRILPGQRDNLISILLQGVARMPGCLSYVVAHDATDPDAIWITEVWDSQKSHQASVTLPPVQLAISKGKPLIAGFGERFETRVNNGRSRCPSTIYRCLAGLLTPLQSPDKREVGSSTLPRPTKISDHYPVSVYALAGFAFCTKHVLMSEMLRTQLTVQPRFREAPFAFHGAR